MNKFQEFLLGELKKHLRKTLVSLNKKSQRQEEPFIKEWKADRHQLKEITMRSFRLELARTQMLESRRWIEKLRKLSL
jgi:hypothetical protein